MNRTKSLLTVAFLFLAAIPWTSESHDPVTATYYVYIGAESDDTVDLVTFGPEGGSVQKRKPVGIFRNEIEGPHGVKVAPDGRHWFVSLAHGLPYGSVYKYETGSDVQVGEVQAGFVSRQHGYQPDDRALVCRELQPAR